MYIYTYIYIYTHTHTHIHTHTHTHKHTTALLSCVLLSIRLVFPAGGRSSCRCRPPVPRARISGSQTTKSNSVDSRDEGTKTRNNREVEEWS